MLTEIISAWQAFGVFMSFCLSTSSMFSKMNMHFVIRAEEPAAFLGLLEQ